MVLLSDIGIRFISAWLFNCYLIGDGGSGAPFVVDAGLSMHAAKIDEALGSNKPACLVATHGHSDHVGGLPALHHRRTAPIWLPARTESYLNGEMPRTPGPKAMAQIWPVALDQPISGRAIASAAADARIAGYGAGTFRFPLNPAGFLDDGEPVPGAPGWEVLHTPGHTDDSISFYNSKDRVLCSGDAVLTCDGTAWFNPEFVDEQASAATEDRLRSVRVDTLLPGHGYPIQGTDLMQSARPHNGRISDPVPYACKALANQIRGIFNRSVGPWTVQTAQTSEAATFNASTAAEASS